MVYIFTLLLLISSLCFWIGIFKPHAFDLLFKGSATRLKTTLATGALGLLSLIMIGVTAPKTNQNDQQTAKTMTSSSPAAPSPTVAATASSAASSASLSASDKSAVIKTLNDSVNSYSALLTEGKQALGTTQYPDSFSGIEALKDPNSAASKWSTFNQEIQAGKFVNSSVSEINAENYYPTNTPLPSALTKWKSDMEKANSDFIEWTIKATDWQINGINNEQLSQYEQKIKDDLSSASLAVVELSKDLR